MAPLRFEGMSEAFNGRNPLLANTFCPAELQM